MKKTLIALLALSGLAMGEAITINQHDGHEHIATSSKHSLLVTATMDADDVKSIITQVGLNTALLSIKVNTSGEKAVSVGSYGGKTTLRTFNETAAGSKVDGIGNVFSWTDAAGKTATANLNDYFSDEGIVAGALTMGYNSSATIGASSETQGIYLAFSVLYSDGKVLTLCGHNSAEILNARHIEYISYEDSLLNAPTIVVNTDTTNAAVSMEQVLKANLQAVPEPTTATLSLLALVGLAARRRRASH